MELHVNESEVAPVDFGDYFYIPLLSGENGCIAGCRTGLLSYSQAEYGPGGVHEDQEGFFVLSGSGKALVGDREFPISPGSCFIVPPGLYHAIKKDPACDCIKLFFFHAAA
ncbi:MAG: hypothetical protein FD137_1095 [Spirochaetes bacterium]|nr:MAG: hypothetical protein FD137_1095 [Spirochaetota bacterium]